MRVIWQDLFLGKLFLNFITFSKRPKAIALTIHPRIFPRFSFQIIDVYYAVPSNSDSQGYTDNGLQSHFQVFLVHGCSGHGDRLSLSLSEEGLVATTHSSVNSCQLSARAGIS